MQFNVGDVVNIASPSKLIKDGRYNPKDGSYSNSRGILSHIGSVEPHSGYYKVWADGGKVVIEMKREHAAMCKNLNTGFLCSVPYELMSHCCQEVDW